MIEPHIAYLAYPTRRSFRVRQNDLERFLRHYLEDDKISLTLEPTNPAMQLPYMAMLKATHPKEGLLLEIPINNAGGGEKPILASEKYFSIYLRKGELGSPQSARVLRLKQAAENALKDCHIEP